MSKFTVSVNGLLAEVKMFRFAGGETQVTFKNPSTSYTDNSVQITAYITDGDIMPLALLVDAIRRTIHNPVIKLHLPYLPYARQDRVMNSGESLAVKVFADMLNSLKLDSIVLDDCHSDVGLALVNNAVNASTLPNIVVSKPSYTLVAPDSGALKKTFKYAKLLGITDVVRADKLRDVTTGNITETVVYGDVQDKEVLILDDICDGGRTFIELAKVLKDNGAKSVKLYITHGIFSKGKECLNEYIDEVTAVYDWTTIG